MIFSRECSLVDNKGQQVEQYAQGLFVATRYSVMST